MRGPWAGACYGWVSQMWTLLARRQRAYKEVSSEMVRILATAENTFVSSSGNSSIYTSIQLQSQPIYARA